MQDSQDLNIYSKIYVLDTNIILDSANNIYKLSKGSTNLIVVPDVVLKELRKYKVGFEDINFNAREFNRLLSDAKIKEAKLNKVTLTFEQNNELITIQIMKGVYDESLENDDKIVQCAKEYAEEYSNTIMISNDIDVRTSAVLENVETEALRLDSVNELSFDFNLTQEVTEDFKQGDLISDVSEKIGVLIPFSISNFEFINTITGKPSYFYRKQNKLERLPEALLKRQQVTPINLPQKFFSSLILEDSIDIVVAEARAGSGKNIVSLSSAMRLLDTKKDKYNKIIYIRKSVPSVDKEAQIGFLKGSASEKLQGFSSPLMDTISFMIEQEHVKKKTKLTKEGLEEAIMDKINSYNIEVLWEGDLRGRTLSNAVVILDESSNFSKKSFQLILTRMGKDTKVIVIGSNRQNDSTYLNKYNNGLTHTLKLCQEPIEQDLTMVGCNLKKAVRSEIAEWADSAYE